MSDSGNISPSAHIALLPSSGMGHLTPFIRLAASLVHHNCKVTFITTHPIVSLSEQNLLSKFLSNFPQIISKHFHLLPFNPENFNSKDPFFLHFESIRRSAHLLSPLLSSSSSSLLSALITDITLASAILPVTTEVHIPNYILFTSSAKMLSFCAHFPKLVDSSFQNTDSIHIPGSSSPIPKSWVPPLLLDPTNLFTTQFVKNGQRLIESNGILINTFERLEPETLEALNNGVVINGFPQVIPIGPLVPCKFEQGSPLTWLDGEVDGSVVYVSFGSRTAMSRAQIRELGDGLVKSGCRFVWVVKDKKVDREDEEGLEEVMGIELMERMKERGLVVKNWVDQEMILSHKSVGGFVSHCGWNSVTESAWHGVRMLAWPQGGDQRINGEVVEKSGFGVWVKSWGWGDEEGEVVKGEEIGEKIREMMSDEGLKMRAMHVREEARRANEVGGSSKKWLLRVIEMWNK